ncbi:IS3 family transposase [Klebsiella quasipneumoniae subsp. quasipneumoniae]
MSKPKYPFEKRLEVVNHYFTTDDGYRIISARFGVPRTQVRTWVALYEKHGEKGLIPKPKGVSADPELRIKVVKAVTEQQYRMRRYQNILKEQGITQSMSRKGNCLDNAVVECFFGTLKSECFYLDEFSNISELKDAVTEYIEYYNSRRISLKLKGLSPIEYRTQTYVPRV